MTKRIVTLDEVRRFFDQSEAPDMPLSALGVWYDRTGDQHYIVTKSKRDGKIYRVPIEDLDTIASFDTSGLVPITRNVFAGANMTGGGPLSADVTLNADNQRRTWLAYNRTGYNVNTWLWLGRTQSDASHGCTPVRNGSVVGVSMMFDLGVYGMSPQTVQGRAFVNGTNVLQCSVVVNATGYWFASATQAAGVATITAATDTLAFLHVLNSVGTVTSCFGVIEILEDS